MPSGDSLGDSEAQDGAVWEVLVAQSLSGGRNRRVNISLAWVILACAR